MLHVAAWTRWSAFLSLGAVRWVWDGRANASLIDFTFLFSYIDKFSNSPHKLKKRSPHLFHLYIYTYKHFMDLCVTNGHPSGTGLCSFLNRDYWITQNVVYSFTHCIYTITDTRVTETYKNDKFGFEITHILTTHKFMVMINKTPYLYTTKLY